MAFPERVWFASTSTEGQKTCQTVLPVELATNFINSGIGEGRLEPYYSAHEDGAELEEAETVDQVPETPVLNGGVPEEEGASAMEVMLHRLLTQSEVTQRTITGMHDRLSALESLEGRLSKLESGGHRAVPLPPPPRSSPQMFDGAGATLGPERLQHLQALAGRGPNRLGDLGLHNRPKSAPQPSTAVAFAGTTEGAEGEDLDGEPWTGNAADSSTVLEKLLASQSAILEKLANSRAAQQDPLAALGGASNLDFDDAPKSTGVRGIAARQMLVDSFRKSPQRGEVGHCSKEGRCERAGSQGPLVYHFQDQVPLGSHRTLTRMAFMAAAMYEAMERNDNACSASDVGLHAGHIRGAGQLRCRGIANGPPDHRPGRPSLCHDRDPQSAKQPLCSWATQRPTLGGYKFGLPAGPRGHYGQEQQVRPSREQQASRSRGRGRSAKEAKATIQAKAAQENLRKPRRRRQMMPSHLPGIRRNDDVMSADCTAPGDATLMSICLCKFWGSFNFNHF